MSRQIQIRRGTAAENDNFTGAIGEVTMDTTNKTLRVHDGETLGGTVLAKQSEIQDIANADYVIEFQRPTAENNYTWYRKYKSGWVEMGGIQTGSAGVSGSTEATLGIITLPVVMANNNYFGTAIGNNYVILMRHEFTTTTATFRFGGYSGNRTLNICRWYISGLSE